MTQATTAPTWHEANQRYLTAALDEVRAALRRHIAAADGDEAPEPPPDAGDVAVGMGVPPALAQLCWAFGLSPFERDVLLLCAGVELEASFAALCGAALGDTRPCAPTFGLALTVLPEAHWSALTPAAPLRHWRLVDVRPGDTLATSPLRIDERVLHYLAGVPHLDENLIGFVQPVTGPDDELVPSHRTLADQVTTLWARRDGQALPVVELCGPEVAGKRGIATAACAALGLPLYRLPATVLPSAPQDLNALLRLCAREAILGGAAVLVDADDVDANDTARVGLLRRFVEESSGPLLLASRERLHVPQRPTVVLDVARPTRQEQHELWRETLGPDAGRLNGHLDRLTAQFDLNKPAIRAAGLRTARERDAGTDAAAGALWEHCRVQARQSLEGNARVVEPAATWDDLVLPGSQLAALRTIELQVRQRLRVYETWGFARRSDRGLGITALFSGPSGTGKTLAAEVLAQTLGLDLYHVDLSTVVSKYIGETEKNLRRVFDAAEAGGAVLLFDEADALFGKRTEVKDSHDRYANLEVSYLLQRMEAYRGLAVLTTNLKGALDEAFERRLRFRVAFPFPDAAQRAAIWGCVFPTETPTEELDTAKLARLNATGGTIRNVALHAAFLAADENAPVGMHHLRDAARSVYAQLDKTLVDREIEGWT